MKIKHSKFKNTGLIYELLVKQITSDLVARKDSPAISILKKYFYENSILLQEYKIYRGIVDATDYTSIKANTYIAESIKAAKKINQKALKEAKYNIISEIKDSYDLGDFFSTPVSEYKTFAAFYCLLEAENSTEPVDPKVSVDNKMTLLEHMTMHPVELNIEDDPIKAFGAQEKDLRLFTFKILLEKFNTKYASLLPEQKNLLRTYISLGHTKSLKEYLNEEMNFLSKTIKELSVKLPKSIERIKLNEALKMLEPISATEKVSDEHVQKVLQFYDLIEELKRI